MHILELQVPGCQNLRVPLRRHARRLVGDQLRDVHADQLVHRVPRHAGIGFVDLEQAAFLADAPETVERGGEDAAQAVVALAQGRLPHLHFGNQRIEGADQLADFIFPGHRQRGQRLPGLTHDGQTLQPLFERNELTADEPPGQCGTDQAQDQGHAKQPLFHGRNRREHFFRRGHHADDPVSRTDALVGHQHFLTQPIDQDRSSLVAIEEMVDDRVHTGCRQFLHDAPAVGRRDDFPGRAIDQQIAAGAAVGRAHGLGHEIAQAQFDLADHDADHPAMLIADRCGHGEGRGIEPLAEKGPADGDMPPIDGPGNQFGIPQIGADTPLAKGHAGQGQPFAVIDDQPAIEQVVENRVRLHIGLDRRRPLLHRQLGRNRHPFQHVETHCQFLVDFLGEQGGQRKLLVAQQLHHVALQQATDEQGQRPAAEQDDREGNDRDSGLQRFATKKNDRLHLRQRACQPGKAVCRLIVGNRFAWRLAVHAFSLYPKPPGIYEKLVNQQ